MTSFERDPAEAAFARERAYLTNLAFRVLGDVAASEDAVQEAFVRLLRAPAGSVDDARGWLIVVTGRICLDQLRSARVRRTSARSLDDAAGSPTDRPGGDPDRTGPTPAVDPADRITLDDEVRRALDVVLERLTPAERVVFVLHDLFRMPFATIAETVGRPESTCRQLASRARRRLAEEGPELASPPPPAPGRRDPDPRADATVAAVTDAFIEACAGGDAERLIRLLDPSVAGDGDFGPDMPAPPLVRGPQAVAQRTLGFLGHGATVVVDPTQTEPTLLAYVEGRLLAVIELTLAGDRIVDLHADGRPARLAAVADDLQRWALDRP